MLFALILQYLVGIRCHKFCIDIDTVQLKFSLFMLFSLIYGCGNSINVTFTKALQNFYCPTVLTKNVPQSLRLSRLNSCAESLPSHFLSSFLATWSRNY